MSKTAVDQVIRRAIGDAAFRAKLQTDPGSALTGFDLTKDERSAITSGDPKRLTALGVDQRMSKAFDLGGQGVVSKMISPEAAGITSKALIDEGARMSKSLIDPGTSAGSASAITAGDEATDAFKLNLRRIEGDLNVASASKPVDVSGEFTRLDEGIVSGTTAAAREPVDAFNANLKRIEGDLNTASAFEPQDVSGEFTRLDEGYVGGSSAAQAAETNTASEHMPGSTSDAGGNTITE